MEEDAEKATIRARLVSVASGYGLRSSGLTRVLGQGLCRLWGFELDADDSAIREKAVAKFNRLIKGATDSSPQNFLRHAGQLSFNISPLTEGRSFLLTNRQRCLESEFRKEKKLRPLESFFPKSDTLKRSLFVGPVRKYANKVYDHMADVIWADWKKKFPNEPFPGDLRPAPANGEVKGEELDTADAAWRPATQMLDTEFKPVTDETAPVDNQPNLRQLTQQSISSPRLRRIVHDLATAVRNQWLEEERIRSVSDPFPLPVRWHNAEEALVDHWQHITRTDQAEPLELSGQLADVVSTYTRIPSGRMVVLGGPGAGKTTLLVRLALDLLAARVERPSVPVPVIFSLSSWTPTTKSLRDWMTDRLADYGLDGSDRKRSLLTARELLCEGWILPVLDGFDEITPGLSGHAMRSLNAAFSPGQPFVLSSRTDEYQAAVERGDVLTATAVIKLEDVTLDDLAAYLPRTTRKLAGGDLATKWDATLVELHAGNTAAAERLRTVLSTPLMVSLARAIYSDTDADPTELLDEQRFPNEATLSGHLLDRIFEAAYAQTPSAGGKQSRYDAGDVRRWLSFLALRMHGLYSRKFQWWDQLSISMVLTISLIPILGATATILALNSGGEFRVVALSLLSGIGCGYYKNAVPAIMTGQPESTLARANLRKRELVFRGLRRGMKLGLRWVLAILIFSALLLIIGVIVRGYILWDLVPRTLLAVVLIIAVFSAFGVLSVSPDLSSAEPGSTLRNNSIGATVDGAVWGALLVAFVALYYRFHLSGLGYAAIVVGVIGGSLVGSLSGGWFLRQACWALLGGAPWRFMHFLEDAHERGILRRIGGEYQFRNVLVQDRLATVSLEQMLSREKRLRVMFEARRSLALHKAELGQADAEEDFDAIIADASRLRFRKRFVLDVRHSRALCARHRGELASAIAQYRAVRDDKRHRLGDRDYSTLFTWLALAETLVDDSRPAEAAQELQSLLEVMSRPKDSTNEQVIEVRRQLERLLSNSEDSTVTLSS